MNQLARLFSINKMNLAFIAIVYFLNIYIHYLASEQAVNVFTDSGVFIYSAKLISEGFVPYKDFFLSNSSFLIYLGALVLKIVNSNIVAFNFIYILWFFSSIIPIYLVTLKFSQNKIAALFSIILFSTFVELVQWDAHSFALRQASLPFLAFSLFFIFVKPKPITAGILLGFFSISIPTNIFIASSLIFTVLLGQFIFEQRNVKKLLFTNLKLIISFLITIICGYFIVLTPQNSIQNLLGYQLNRPFAPYNYRFDLLIGLLKLNWPIVILGGLGSLVLNRKVYLFGLSNILTFLIIVFTGASFYPHYIAIMGVGLSISAGIFIGFICRSLVISVLTVGVILLVIYQTTFQFIKINLIEKRSPDFFKVVKQLKTVPEPIFTYEPIYALYANRHLTNQYYSADMRYFRVEGKNLSEPEYLDILGRSNSVLLQNSWSSFVPLSSIEYINQQFRLIYSDPENKIFVRKVY